MLFERSENNIVSALEIKERESNKEKEQLMDRQVVDGHLPWAHVI